MAEGQFDFTKEGWGVRILTMVEKARAASVETIPKRPWANLSGWSEDPVGGADRAVLYVREALLPAILVARGRSHGLPPAC